MASCAGLQSQLTNTNSSPERRGGGGRGGGGARAHHERLVAYAHHVAGSPESRAGVWGEHSYARARDGAPTEVRELLTAALGPAPAAPPPAAPLDVEHVPRDRTPALPALADDDADADAAPSPVHEHDEEDEQEEQWEARMSEQAPSGAHARLADAAANALRELRLARLASAGARGGAWLRREQARAAARHLRRALASLWAGGGAAARAPAWLHGALCAALPRRTRALYDEVLTELRRAVPKLAERLAPQPPPGPLDAPEPADDGLAHERRGGEGGDDAVLVWVSAGGASDERWLRRLRPLLRTRELRAAGPTAAAPERWCAALAGAARSRLGELLADIGSRYVVLGGAGAGAALCAALAAGTGRVRALLLLAPPLLTAEGARDEPDDVLHELRVPMLVVCGGGGAACGRAAAAALVARGARGDRAARRLLLLGAADDALRVPAALRRALRLPQDALDAAVADECARWVRSVARGRPERGERQPADACGPEGEEPAAGAGPARAPGSRVVSRVCGGTPLALAPPRRAPDALDAADIMQLPIVFADDEPPEGALTVRSGARGKLTRVIVARRGGRPARGARPGRPPRPPPL